MPSVPEFAPTPQGVGSGAPVPSWPQGVVARRVPLHARPATAARKPLGATARRALIALYMLMALTLLPAFAPVARAHGLSDSDPKHGVHLASPAVVRIISDVAGQVICHECAADGQTLTFPLDRPTYDVYSSGSGAFVSPDGYVLTADHVVEFDRGELAFQFFDAAVADLAVAEHLTLDQAKAVQQAADSAGNLDIPMRVLLQRVFVATTYTGQLHSPAQIISYPVTRIAAHSPPGAKDIAILKVDAQDVPNLAPAPSGSVHVQDAATAVAFPADADTGDFGALVHPTAADITTISGLLSPTVETGSVIAQKPLPDGTTAYETTGISNHGSSGGAVLDTQGRIIGFVDRFTSGASDRVTILVPSDVILDYMRQVGIANAGQGQFQTAWTKAITTYDASGPCHADADLRALHAQYPQFGAIQPYLDTAQANTASGACAKPAPSGPPAWLIAGGAGAGLLILLALTVGLLATRGRRRPAALVAAAPPFPEREPTPSR